MDILELVPRGHENAISRKNLCMVTGLTDREMRRLLAQTEEPVFNVGDGYFRYLDEKDIPLMKSYMKQELNRAGAISGRMRAVRKLLNSIERGNVWQSEECSQAES